MGSSKGKGDADTRSMAWLRIDLQSAAKDLYALLHPQQPEIAGAGGPLERLHDVESHAVIADDEIQKPVSLAQLNPDALRSRMPHDIGQRLLSHAEGGDRRIAGHIDHVTHDLGEDAGTLLMLFGKPSQGRLHTARFQHGRTKLERQTAHLRTCAL